MQRFDVDCLPMLENRYHLLGIGAFLNYVGKDPLGNMVAGEIALFLEAGKGLDAIKEEITNAGCSQETNIRLITRGKGNKAKGGIRH